MQLSHYEWVEEVYLFNIFRTSPGDTLNQTGPGEYVHTNTRSGDTSNLTISPLAIQDFLTKGYLKLIKTVGENTEQNFDSIKPFVLHADKQEAENPGTVPVNYRPESVEIIKIDKPEKPVTKKAKESVEIIKINKTESAPKKAPKESMEIIKMERPVKTEVVVTEHHLPITEAEPEPEPQILTALLDGVLQDAALESQLAQTMVKKVTRGRGRPKKATTEAPKSSKKVK